MEVFQSSGDEGVLSICIDGGKPVVLNFKNNVQVSVSFTSKNENTIDNLPVSETIKTSSDVVDFKEKQDPLDEELNGFIQRVKHSENGSSSLFPTAAQDFFSENGTVQSTCGKQEDDYSAVIGDGSEKTVSVKCENKRKREVEDDDELDDESVMDMEDSCELDNESMESEKHESVKEEVDKNKVDGSDAKVKSESVREKKSEPAAVSSTASVDKPGLKLSEVSSKQKDASNSSNISFMNLQKKYMRLKGKKIHTIYKCNICEREFNDSYMLSVHQRAENAKVTCSMCDLECMSKANLIVHEHLMHSSGGKINGKVCPVCKKPFSKHSDILNHIRSEHTNEGLYRCCLCQTLFQNYFSFKVHLDSHRMSKESSGNANEILMGKNLVRESSSPRVMINKAKPASGTAKKVLKKSIEDVATTSKQKPQVQKHLRSLMNYQVPKPDPKPIKTAPPAKPSPTNKMLPPGKMAVKSLPPNKIASPNSMLLLKNFKSMLGVKNTLASKSAPPNKTILQVKLPSKAMLSSMKRPVQALPTQSKMSLSPSSRSKRLMQLMRSRLPQQAQSSLARKTFLSRKPYINEKLWKCHFCERVFKSKGDYINHKKPSRITQMCKECGFTSTSKALYLIHEYQKHTHRHNDRYTLVNEDLRCHICEEPIALNEVLNHVMSKHTGEYPYECCVCKVQSSTYEEWVKHGKTHLRTKEERSSLTDNKLISNLSVKTEETEKNNNLFCNLCKEYYPNDKDFVRHHKCESGKKECELCRVLCYTEAGYIIHKSITHGVSPNDANNIPGNLTPTNFSGNLKMWHEDDMSNDNNSESTKCPSCEESIEMKDLLSHVMTVHTQESPYKCCACKTQCPKLEDYLEHCNFHLGKKLYNTGTQRCLVCGLRFDSRIRLSRHKIMHKPSCPYCHMEFNSKALLDVHLKNLHTNDMTACGFCGKLFADMNQLAEHERNHYFYKKSQCPICGVMVTNVNKHLARKHPKPDTQFLCNLCGQKFPLRCDLSRHLSKHSNDRRHECDICKKTFKRAAGLRRHAQSHLQNRKMHECHICGKKCSQRNNLSVHMRVHASVKAFTCEHCGQGFNYNQSLQTHIRKKHINGPTTSSPPTTSSRTTATRTSTDTVPMNPVNIQPNTQPPVRTATATASYQEHPGYPDSSQHYYPEPPYVPVNAFQRSYSDLINTIVRSEHETPHQGPPQQGYPVFYPQF